MFGVEALESVPSSEGAFSARHVWKLTSVREELKTMTSEASLPHVTVSGNGFDFAARFDSDINPSAAIQNVGVR